MAVPSRGAHTNTNKRMDLTALASAFVRSLRILITNTLTASVRTVEFSESVNCYESLSIPNPRAAHVLKLQKESHLALGNDIQEQVLDLDLSQQSYYQWFPAEKKAASSAGYQLAPEWLPDVEKAVSQAILPPVDHVRPLWRCTESRLRGNLKMYIFKVINFSRKYDRRQKERTCEPQ
ncbi:hypothetical protein C8J57DRAFT_1221883 [Mycena rebaudengoi]|nr:hypothetical protein C8J57DRAFT_1221883 [Mycena rebaudengoi]